MEKPTGTGGRGPAGKAQPVDEGAIVRQPEQVRLGVRLLRFRRHRPQLEEAEAQRRQRSRRLGVLVEPAGEPDRRGKIEPHDPRAQPRIRRAGEVGDQRPRRRVLLDQGQRAERKPVRGVRRETEERAAQEPVADHGAAEPTANRCPASDALWTELSETVPTRRRVILPVSSRLARPQRAIC
jgi:hypothetical protein